MFNLTTKAYISVTEAIRNFKNDQRGVTAIEYGLIAIAMAAFIVFVFSSKGGFIEELRGKFDQLGKTLQGFDVTKKN